MYTLNHITGQTEHMLRVTIVQLQTVQTEIISPQKVILIHIMENPEPLNQTIKHITIASLPIEITTMYQMLISILLSVIHQKIS